MAEEAQTEVECLVRLDDLQGRRAAGSITVAARSEARPRRLVSEHFERLTQAGVAVDEIPALLPVPAPDLFATASTLRPIGRSAEEDVDVRVMVLEGDSGAVLLAVNGPTRGRSALAWAVHQRAFEIARDTVYAV